MVPSATNGPKEGGPEKSSSSDGAAPTSEGSGDVYIDPDIWSSQNPDLYCIPPCVLILPPLTLSKPTTISFPLYTTSLEVARKTTTIVTVNGKVSTSTGYDRVTQTTTLTIPPVTTDRIDFWNVNITGGTSSVFHATSSILPPPFVITNDRNPRKQSGVTDPIITRTITPPPFPYETQSTFAVFPPPISFTSKGDDDDSKPGGAKGKKGGPSCTSGCGHKCGGGGVLGVFIHAVFCNKPCLLNCLPHPRPDFIDPSDPDPPKLPELPPGPGLPPGPPGPPPGPGSPPGGGGGNDNGPPPGPNPKDDNKKSPSKSSSKSCTTSTVTDYFVSCTTVNSKSTSCKTTSSSLVQGCDIQATTILTASGRSCPIISLDPNDDQGEDGTASRTTASATHSGGLQGPAETAKEDSDAHGSSAALQGPAASPQPAPKSTANPPGPKLTASWPREYYVYLFGYFRYCDGHGKHCKAQPTVFDWTNDWPQKDVNYCGTKPLWTAPNRDNGYTTSFPENFGPFDMYAKTGCYISRKDAKSVGDVKCDQGGNFGCNLAPGSGGRLPATDCYNIDVKVSFVFQGFCRSDEST